ncbi:MAG: hypothetical protein HY645_09090 [Acidobacteria bacterium]|nr:hypothetical protein [Acidobacteriota bacterium]
MQERDFYHERRETKPAHYTCPYCRQTADFQIRWLIREKKKELPRGASAEDHQKFAKMRSYMIREDDYLLCPNSRCRRRFEIPTQQSVVFL